MQLKQITQRDPKYPLPPVITPGKTVAQYHNQKTDTGKSTKFI